MKNKVDHIYSVRAVDAVLFFVSYQVYPNSYGEQKESEKNS